MRHAEEPWAIPLDVRLMNLASRILLGVTLIGLCAGGVVWLLDQPRFDLRVIQVRGQGELEHNNEATLKMAVASKIRGNFFTVDLEEVRAVFESAPWIRQATVSRMWPYGLSVVVQEYEPVALWGNDRQTSYMLDVYGEVFEANAANIKELGLPLLDGPSSQKNGELMWGMYQRLAVQMAAIDWRIDTLRLSEQGTWSMKMGDGTQIIIGRGDLDVLESRVHDFVQTVEVALKPYGERTLLVADLRHKDGYAVQIAGMQTARVTEGAPGASSLRR